MPPLAETAAQADRDLRPHRRWLVHLTHAGTDGSARVTPGSGIVAPTGEHALFTKPEGTPDPPEWNRGYPSDRGPKSQTSRREVPMGDRVARALELHHQATEYDADDDHVFCHPQTGRPYDPSKLRDRFYDAMKTAGLGAMLGRDGGGIVFHPLRHTFGTQMASSGAPLVAIKEWMGHADIQTTMIYAKWSKDRAAERALVDRASGAIDAHRSETVHITHAGHPGTEQ